MVEIATNPGVETLKFAVGITGAIIALLLVIVAYFLRKQITVSESLTSAVNGLTLAVGVIQTQQNERDPRTERRLNSHSRQLQLHNGQIIRLSEKAKLKYDDQNEKEEEDEE